MWLCGYMAMSRKNRKSEIDNELIESSMEILESSINCDTATSRVRVCDAWGVGVTPEVHCGTHFSNEGAQLLGGESEWPIWGP